MNIRFRLCLILSAALIPLAKAEVHIAPQRMDYPTLVESAVERLAATQLYRYSYRVSNPPSNPAAVGSLWIDLPPGARVVGPISSPLGWRADLAPGQSRLLWFAAGDEETPDQTQAVTPGQQLDGFAFESFSPPQSGIGYTQTERPIPSADDAEEIEVLPYASSLPEENGHRVALQVPQVESWYAGNRRPAVDTFLVFMNIRDRDAFRGSVLVAVRFGVGGEEVDLSSFRAWLNREEVTSAFAYSPAYDAWVARFVPQDGLLETGSNVLETSVLGRIPGQIDRPTLDRDRVVFSFQP